MARAESWAVSSGVDWGSNCERVAAVALAVNGAAMVPIWRTSPPRLTNSRLARPILTAVATAVLVLRPVVLAVAAAAPAMNPPPLTTERPGLLKKAVFSGPERKRLVPRPRPRAEAIEPIGWGASSITRLLAWALGEMVSCRPPPRSVVPGSSCRATALDKAVVIGWNSMVGKRVEGSEPRQGRGPDR